MIKEHIRGGYKLHGYDTKIMTNRLALFYFLTIRLKIDLMFFLDLLHRHKACLLVLSYDLVRVVD